MQPGMAEMIIGGVLLVGGIFIFSGIVEIALAVIGVVILSRGLQKRRAGG